MLIRRLALLGRLYCTTNGRELNHARYFSKVLVAGWPESIKNFLERENIRTPTLIQEKTLPIVMDNKNLVGIARTGSGKTLAFAIPAVMKVLASLEDAKNNPTDNQQDDENYNFPSFAQGTRKATCLVLSPTRELASQTFEVFNKFRTLGLRSISLVGGSSRSAQLLQLRKEDCDIYIATPGRLMDLINSRDINLKHIKYLVVDEADRMLDMGFEPQVRNILRNIPKDRQTLMYSATWPKEIQDLAKDFLGNYEYVAIDSEQLKANPNIRQVIKFCEPHGKFRKLMDLMVELKKESDNPRVLVFVNTKRLADSLLIQLMRNRIKAVSIHGDRSQMQRDQALRQFKSKACNVMIATDVAARGLDISDITHVVNYDMPRTIEDYIHRIGRTARHDCSGTSVSLFTGDDASLSNKLITVLRETSQEVPEKLVTLAQSQHFHRSKSTEFGVDRRRPRDDFYSGIDRSVRRNPRYDDGSEHDSSLYDHDDDSLSHNSHGKNRYRDSDFF